MSYLVTQMLLCLLIAFLLGLLIGWLLNRCCCKKKLAKLEGDSLREIDAKPASIATATAQADDGIIDLDTAVELDGEGYEIETVEGIGKVFGQKLRGIGIDTVGNLLRKAHKAPMRKKISEDLIFKPEDVDAWVSMSDLLRIQGLDHQNAELLNAAGIHNVQSLSRVPSPEELVSKLVEVNESGKKLIAPTVPSTDDVTEWVKEARDTKPVLS